MELYKTNVLRKAAIKENIEEIDSIEHVIDEDWIRR